MSSHDRRGSRPGSAPSKSDAPWLKDRPDLHRTEREEGVIPRGEADGSAPVAPDVVDNVLRQPAETGREGERRPPHEGERRPPHEGERRRESDGRGPGARGTEARDSEARGSEARGADARGPDQRVIPGAREGSQPVDGQGDATKARRRPS